MNLDFAAIGRILEKVAAAGTAIPREFYPSDETAGEIDHFRTAREARQGLAQEISWSITMKSVFPLWTSNARNRARYEALGRIARLSRDLVVVLEDEEMPFHHILSDHDPANTERVTYTDMVTGLRAMSEAATTARARLRRLGLHERALFNLEWSDGDNGEKQSLGLPFQTQGNAYFFNLGKTFQKFFGAEVVITQVREAEPTGPFIAFVQAIQVEAGQPVMKADAIRKAWERAIKDAQQDKNIEKP